jgi:hypothetical protein
VSEIAGSWAKKHLSFAALSRRDVPAPGRRAISQGERVMLRQWTIALAAALSVGLVMPGAASAHGGGHGGGFHGGGFHGGFGGFHHHGFGPGFGFGFGLGLAPYPYYGDYYPYYGDPYYQGYDGGCYLVRRHVHTRHGWRLRTIQVCP